MIVDRRTYSVSRTNRNPDATVNDVAKLQRVIKAVNELRDAAS